MSTDVNVAPSTRSEPATDHRAGRIARLYDEDPDFTALQPRQEVMAAAARPGMRLSHILDTFMRGYGTRPVLGQRAREVHTDPQTGHTTVTLGDRFDTLTRTELWDRVAQLAAALAARGESSVRAGEFVAIVGFASPDYLTVDLSCAYLGLVSVPLQHNAAPQVQAAILAETRPAVIAVSADYLAQAVAAAEHGFVPREVIVFDDLPALQQHRDALDEAHRRLDLRGVRIRTLDAVIAEGRNRPAVPPFTGATPDRLAMILYTSGSTGTPKGAMYTEAMLSRLWTTPIGAGDEPVVNLNFLPLNHLGGRIPLVSAIQSGGTSHFAAAADLSTLFDDLALVRPTELALVPRVADMLHQHFLTVYERCTADGAQPHAAAHLATAALRDGVLGGRVISGLVATAPLSAELGAFLDRVLGVHLVDAYGLTETGPVAKDGVISRPPVLDYKLVDVPELGYFVTDQPHPRGELLIKSQIMFPGYYRRPELTASVFDADGYYRSGDVMAEISRDHLVYVDRRNNVIKLAQGEFVAVANLEAVYANAEDVHQIYVYGNSERATILAVIVPTATAIDRYGDGSELRAVLNAALQSTARSAGLQPYEIPADFIIETEPFTTANGLLSGVGKLLRPNLKARYGDDLEALYDDIAAAQDSALSTLRRGAEDRPVGETVLDAARIILGASHVGPHDRFIDLGGDSLSALTLSTLLSDVFDVEVPVATIINPASDLSALAEFIATRRHGRAARPTAATVHGGDTTAVHARDLTLPKFIDTATLEAARDLPHTHGTPRTVLITGGNGWLGRFLTLEWLERLAPVEGRLIALIRGRDDDDARTRLRQSFTSDLALLRRFDDLAHHLDVWAGDVGEPNLALTDDRWDRLARDTDRIVHPAALVNHVLPYPQLFGPNVIGTAELIRLAMTHRLTPIDYLSTVAVAATVQPEDFLEDGDIRYVCPTRPVDDSYASGYATSKWAGEVLLREAHDLCGLPVAVFRSDLILAHQRYSGQLNLPDMFTRLIYSLLITGLAPHSFYPLGADGGRSRAHYDGLPVDFVAQAITTLGAAHTDGYVSYDVMNPHDDGISLDVFVDWLIDAGHDIHRIRDYEDWLDRFAVALRQLPAERRQHSVLPLLHAFTRPETPLTGAAAPTDVFRSAVRDAGIGADRDIPHITTALIAKYAADLREHGLLR